MSAYSRILEPLNQSNVIYGHAYKNKLNIVELKKAVNYFIHAKCEKVKSGYRRFLNRRGNK